MLEELVEAESIKRVPVGFFGSVRGRGQLACHHFNYQFYRGEGCPCERHRPLEHNDRPEVGNCFPRTAGVTQSCAELAVVLPEEQSKDKSQLYPLSVALGVFAGGWHLLPAGPIAFGRCNFETVQRPRNRGGPLHFERTGHNTFQELQL